MPLERLALRDEDDGPGDGVAEGGDDLRVATVLEPQQRHPQLDAERGLIAEAGREDSPGGAVRYRTTPLFERVFGLEGLSELPRLDDLGDGPDELRERLVAVAERRAGAA